MAEGILRQLFADNPGKVHSISAGVGAAPGMPVSTNSVLACTEIGIDISGHVSQSLTPSLVDACDLILAMEEHHRFAAEHMSPHAAERIHLLSRYASGEDQAPPMGVADPIGGDLDEYRHTLREIRFYIDQALPRLKREIEADAVES